tara:strand:- start:7343 stop:8539 length:1197 start_codon:yes stop_codon:yes gene_type:complete
MKAVKILKNSFLYFPMLFLNAIYLISFLIPKKRGLWLFSSWFGKKYLDNPKYIYQELLKNNHDIQAYWLVKDKDLLHRLEDLEYPVLNAFSIKGFLLQLRAEVVVFTHSVQSEFVPCLIASQTKKIQTWHGIPIKKIGFDSQNTKQQRRDKNIRFFLPFLREDYDLVTAVSIEDKIHYHSAFRIPLEKIKITGYPRNDEIFRSSKNKSEDDNFKIIYMPTLRGVMNDEFNLLSNSNFDFDFELIDKRLSSLNVTLFIKLHPVQVFTQKDKELIKTSKHIKAIFNDDDDIYESLGEYDVLITDYSGIFFDFMISGKPIIMAPLDYDSYTKNDRAVYYEYNSICPSPPCNNWKEILNSIELLMHNQDIPIRYYEIQNKFHKYTDDRSSERVIEEIKRIVS